MPSIIPKVTINGKESSEIAGLIIVSLPPIRKPAMRAVAEEIDGRDGDQIEKLGFSAYDKPIKIALSGSYNIDDVIEYFNQDGIITFSNEPDKYYRFKQLEGIDFEKLMRYKTADVVFHCQPFKFSTTDKELTFFEPRSVSITNAGNIYSKPEIALTGHGNMEMSINGSPVLAVDFGDDQQTIIIDSEKMNAYGTQSNIKSLITEINPEQDLHGYDSAWIDSDSGDNIPYIKRNVAGTASRIGNALIDKLIGGSYAWNQQYPTHNAYQVTTGDISGVDITFTDGYINISGSTSALPYTEIDVFPHSAVIPANHVCLILCDGYNGFSWRRSGFPGKSNSYYINKHDVEFRGDARIRLDAGTTYNIHARFSTYDLTQMLGATIADYIYSLEQATAGAGVSWFRNLFPDDYYPYNTGELLSVKTSAHIMRNASNAIIGNYALDANLELRGIPQIDANGNLTYDGDEYSSDGSVIRRYGIVDLSTLTWTWNGLGFGWFYSSDITDIKYVSSNTQVGNALASKYTLRKAQGMTSAEIGEIAVDVADIKIRTGSRDITPTGYLIYEKATPTTETANPFTNPQNLDANGSEEYVDARAVKIPVGHDSMHANICEIEGWNACDVTRTGKNFIDDNKRAFSGNSITLGSETSRGKCCYLPAGTYTISVTTLDGTGTNLYCQDLDDNVRLFSAYGTLSYTFTLSKGTNVTFWAYKAEYTSVNDITSAQLELGSEATDFEAYEGIIKTIPFGQTVYKARLNITTGRMEILGAVVDLGSLNYTYYQYDGEGKGGGYSDGLRNLVKKPTSSEQSTGSISSGLLEFSDNDFNINHYTDAKFAINIYGAIKVCLYSAKDANDLKRLLTGITLCYPLASPIILQLTAQEIMALIGENHIFTNTGAIESCVYMKDGAEIETSGEIITFIADVGDIISNALKNRLVIGNYDNVKLEKGINTISFNPIEENSEIDEMAISKYSRWL